MLIFSWNVAGLSTTVNRIHETYSTRGDKQSALKNLFMLHNADIVCLQEHKIPRKCLADRSDPRLFATTNGAKDTAVLSDQSDHRDYESFWSCCVDETRKGLNGVVTYARTGTVVSSTSTPLMCPELDVQGRCVMTHHGTFVLFNVYVPCRGGPFKMKFLRALRHAMKVQREKGLPVILVGDLNISYDRHDVYWKDRTVRVDDILNEVTNAKDVTGLPSWKVDVSSHWNTIESALSTKEAASTTTTNSATRESYSKFRLAITVDGGRRVFLGNHETSEEDCLYYYDFGGFSYWEESIQDHVQMKQKNHVSVAVLAELLLKVCNVQWTDDVIRQIADETAGVDQETPTRQWLRSVLHEDDMIDAFRHFYPDAEARFTCWNQNKNCRYANQGTRIDYTLIDRSLLPLLQQGNSTLRCDGTVPEGEELSESAALRAATASGRFQPAAYEGGGIVEPPRSVLDSQFGPPYTGHIYTPPTFSDHIGVSVLLDNSILPRQDLLIDVNDAATRKAQPQRQQRSVTDFFKSGSSTLAGKGNTAASKRKVSDSTTKSGPKRSKVPANSVLHHFGRTKK